jgi:L,D-transpeptidase catalytic domain
MKNFNFIKLKRIQIILALLVFAVCAIPFRVQLRRIAVGVIQTIKGRHTINDRVEQFGNAVRQRLVPEFRRLDIAYPPGEIIIVGLKQENRLEVWVSEANKTPKLLKTYPILGASGSLGPKLQDGDMQVPEGLYEIESLNPNSMYHLALRVNYPNEFDKIKGKLDGRKYLGGDIMIHGKNCSIGCLAMGDKAAEELFVLAAETGIDNIKVILSPVDFRIKQLPSTILPQTKWTPELYKLIKKELEKLKE